MPPQTTAEPLPVIGYIRVSLAREEMISPDIQRQTITGWATRTNRHIVDWVVDLDKSGRNIKRRITQAIARVEAGEAKGIAVYRYDRWGRNTTDSLANIARVENIGGGVESATEPLDPATAMGRYNRTNALALAEMQSDLIGENWKAAHANRLTRGLPATGRPRFGYLRKGRIPHPANPRATLPDPTDQHGERYEPDLDGVAEIVVALYRQYVAGATGRALCNWLNSLGARTSTGTTWSIHTLFVLLDSGFAAGLLRVHNPECGGCPDASSCRNTIYLPGAQKPLIPPALWKAYLARRKKIAALAPRARKATYTLSGLLKCGHCHRAASHGHERDLGPGGILQCSTFKTHGKSACRSLNVRRHHAEAAVVEQLRQWAADIDAGAAAPQAPPAAGRTDTDRLHNERDRIDTALARLVADRALDPDMPDTAYAEARRTLMERRKRVEASITDAEDSPPTIAVFAPIIVGVLDEWDVMSPAARRDLLLQLVRHVTLSRADGGRAVITVQPLWEACDEPCCEGRRARRPQ